MELEEKLTRTDGESSGVRQERQGNAVETRRLNPGHRRSPHTWTGRGASPRLRCPAVAMTVSTPHPPNFFRSNRNTHSKRDVEAGLGFRLRPFG